MLSRRFKIAPHRSGGNERSNHPRPRIEWLGRGMGPGNGTLAVPGDSCRSTRGRLEDAFDAASRMATGQHLSLACEFYWGRTAFARRPICQQMKREKRVNFLLREPNSIALGNSLDRDKSRAFGRTIPWRFACLLQSCRSPECIVWFPQQCSEHPGG